MIALVGFYSAWRLWRVRKLLASATATIVAWEQDIQRQLEAQTLTEPLVQGQRAMMACKQGYQRWAQQMQQLQQGLTIAMLVLRLMRRQQRQPSKRLRIW